MADKSQIVDALVAAAENGKEVVVLCELRARFDEENNIEMSHRLEDAGCRILYGLGDYKVHSKLCLITRKKGEEIEYITQIGTGNYNEKTASLYTDFSLITARKEIGMDVADVFTALQKGEVVEDVKCLLVAPKCLQNRILSMIDEEIENKKAGKKAYIGIKINSLTDKDIIDKLLEASMAGVKIDLIIRGICCLRPNIPDISDNIRVISIVGRYLEHSRIYRFGT
nr:RNA degradosome polyphosphate kinase [Prevotella sp.]